MLKRFMIILVIIQQLHQTNLKKLRNLQIILIHVQIKICKLNLKLIKL